MKKVTIDQALQKGIEAHKAGEVEEAERLYQEVLKEQPKNPVANHNVGLLAMSIGNTDEALPFLKTAVEVGPKKAQFWLSYIIALIKLERIAEAQIVFAQVKSNGAKGVGFDQIEQRLKHAQGKSRACTKVGQNSRRYPPQNQLQLLMDLYTDGQITAVIERAQSLLEKYPEASKIWNLMGVSAAQIGRLDLAIFAFRRVLAIDPSDAEGHNNIANAFSEQGKLDEALEAYRKALMLKPDYVDVCNGMGIVLTRQGKFCEATEAYRKGLDINPDCAQIHHSLSSLITYDSNHPQISKVESLLQCTNFNGSDRCLLYYAYAKIKEDLGELDVAFDSYVRAGKLRQNEFAYDFADDQRNFSLVKKTAPRLRETSIPKLEQSKQIPIFILGMPRSGTTLVEQIVSSHPEVTGAGELNWVTRFGSDLVFDKTPITKETVQVFREHYLAELAKSAGGRKFLTDKMPQNFLNIALICASLPEAKIVHVQRQGQAVCWSNFTNYFSSKALSYSYNLEDCVNYFGLYRDLMSCWCKNYNNQIYHLFYEDLTENQESETERLLAYLGLNWEDACLAPQNNKRSVKTASQKQVRQAIYRGSSQAWMKYEPFLNGVFDVLET